VTASVIGLSTAEFTPTTFPGDDRDVKPAGFFLTNASHRLAARDAPMPRSRDSRPSSASSSDDDVYQGKVRSPTRSESTSRVNRTVLSDESFAINREVDRTDRDRSPLEGCRRRKTEKNLRIVRFCAFTDPDWFFGPSSARPCPPWRRNRATIVLRLLLSPPPLSLSLSLSLARAPFRPLVSLRRDTATRGWPWTRVYRHIHPTLRRRSLVDEELATLARGGGGGYKNVIVRRTHGALHVEAKSTRARPSRIVTSLARTPFAFRT